MGRWWRYKWITFHPSLTTGAGSEVMSRIAAPMIGGMITAPLLSLFIIPAAYKLIWLRRHKKSVS